MLYYILSIRLNTDGYIFAAKVLIFFNKKGLLQIFYAIIPNNASFCGKKSHFLDLSLKRRVIQASKSRLLITRVLGSFCVLFARYMSILYLMNLQCWMLKNRHIYCLQPYFKKSPLLTSFKFCANIINFVKKNIFIFLFQWMAWKRFLYIKFTAIDRISQKEFINI